MQVVTINDTNAIQMLINEFLITKQIGAKESIPIELLKYLRENDVKIEDGVLINQMLDLIEKKLVI